MKKLKISDGQIIQIDKIDEELVSTRRWYTIKADGVVLAVRSTERPYVYIGRFLLGVKDGYVVDHIDGNPLNNQKSNLRHCTQAENAMNRKISKNNKCGFKGVTKEGRKYRAAVTYNETKYRKSGFLTPEDAHEWYNNKARELFGEYHRE